jgi:signal transduction histidine kinase
MTELHPPASRRDDRRSGAGSPGAAGDLQALHLRASVLPAAAMGLLGLAAAVFLFAGKPSASTAWVVLAIAAVAGVAVLAGAAYAAVAVTRRVHEQVGSLRSLSSRSREELQQLAGQVQRGERPDLRDPEPVPAGKADPFSLLANDLHWQQRVAGQAVLKAARSTAGSETDQRVEVFVNLAWRIQSLAHRQIQLLDGLQAQAQAEDAGLLKGLSAVDHLATRMRRQSESLAVLGGAVSRRQQTGPVTLHQVLRAAVTEVEQAPRVKVVPPVEGVLTGSAVADVIHLVAELVENATKFSAPDTQALLRAQNVTAGLAIEVEDRGLGMPARDRQSRRWPAGTASRSSCRATSSAAPRRW